MLGRSIGRLAATERQYKIETASALNTAQAIHHRGLNPYPAAMGFNRQLAESKAKSHSISARHFTGFEGTVLIENALVIRFRYSDTFIFHADNDMALLPGIHKRIVLRRDEPEAVAIGRRHFSVFESG